MNNLVAYDADSDDESPRRRSSDAATIAKKLREEEERRKRRSSDVYGDEDNFSPPSARSDSGDSALNFIEPPPPKRITDHSPSPASFRTPQIGMPHTHSQASLVSYSGDGDDGDDDVEEEDQIDHPISDMKPKLVREGTPEPAAPIRQSYEADEEEQKLIDKAIEEGNEAINRMNEEMSPMDTPGRDSVTVDSPMNLEQSDDVEVVEQNDHGELRIPPAPDVEVNPAILARFEHAFRQKSHGTDLNQQIQGNQQYNNPMSYETFIDTFDIDEKGTNFPRNIFDPHCFPENCFYDAISEEQKKLTEATSKKK